METELERRAEEIFDQTLDAPTTDRLAAIDAACAGDPQLLARVKALAAADQSDGFLGNPTMDAAPVLEQPGSVIGRYKLIEQIGEGGFGVVFKAEQEKPVRRSVALKIIKLGMDTREVVARFEAERQALAMMDHPNIAKVLDAGSTDAGRPYFVMELVRGFSDHRVLRQTETQFDRSRGADGPGLPGRAACPQQGRHPSGPQTDQRAGDGRRR